MEDPKTEARDDRPDDDLELPDEHVDDLEPGEDEAADVKGGAWPKKYSGETP